MSDALTDIARDERRAKHFSKYLEAVKEYLLKPSKKTLNTAAKAAELTDAVPRGYFGKRTSISEDVKERLRKLKNNNKQEWARFLAQILNSDYFLEFKKLSPFKDNLILCADYSRGYRVDIEGQIQNLVNKIIQEKKNWKIYDGDSYLVIIDIPSLKTADAFWLGCGICGITGPRKNKSNKSIKVKV